MRWEYSGDQKNMLSNSVRAFKTWTTFNMVQKYDRKYFEKQKNNP